MTFAHPALAAAAIAAVAIPIAIHLLFRRRRVPLEWAAMELLREAVRRTNRRTKLEQWALLALRSLAVLAAGLALAVPLASDAIGTVGRRTTWMVVVDDGATSGLLSGAGSAGSPRELDRLVDEVRSVLSGRSEGDRVGIVTASARPAIVLAPTADFAEAERVLARLVPTEAPTDLPGAIALAQGAFSGSSQDASGAAPDLRRLVVASGFRRASLPDGALLGGTGGTGSSGEPGSPQPAEAARSGSPATTDVTTDVIVTAPAGDEPVDARIRDIEARMLPSSDALAVRAVVSRAGRDLREAQTRVRAEADGFITPPQRTVRWESGQSDATVEFQLARDARAESGPRAAGRRSVRVEIEEDALGAGNTAHRVVDARQEIEVGVVGRRGSLDASDLDKVPASLWVARALAPGAGGGMRVREIDPSACDARALLGLDAVVLARPDLLASSSIDAVASFVRAGGVAIVLPAGESLVQAWTSELLPRLGVSARVAPEAQVLPEPLRLAQEQPRSPLLSTVRPEIDALASPVEATRALRIEGVSSGEVVLSFSDGTPFVVAQVPRRADGATEVPGPSADGERMPTALESGLVVLFASAPELPWTNLPVKPLMVPLLQESVRAGLQIAASRDEVAVGSFAVSAPLSTLQGPEGVSLTTGPDGVSTGIVRVAGVWRGETGAAFASNIREESIAIAPTSLDSVRQSFAPLGGARVAAAAGGGSGGDAAQESRTSLSAWAFPLLVLALAALLVEGVLSRTFSHLSAARAGAGGAGLETVGRIRTRTSSLRRADPLPDADLASRGGVR